MSVLTKEAGDYGRSRTSRSIKIMNEPDNHHPSDNHRLPPHGIHRMRQSVPLTLDQHRRYSKAISGAFGVVLRARITADLTQEELAFRAGVDRTYPSLLERGRRQPTLIVILVLARSLGAEPEELLAQARMRRTDSFADKLPPKLTEGYRERSNGAS